MTPRTKGQNQKSTMPNLARVNEDVDDAAFFGQFPNPDPEDNSPRDQSNQFVYLLQHNRRVSHTYSAIKKRQVFFDALSLDAQALFLGEPVPPKVHAIYSTFRKQARRKNSMTIPALAEPLYLLSKYVFELHLRRAGGDFDSKAVALVAFYEYMISFIDAEEADRQNGIEKARKAASKAKSKGSKGNALPDNFKWDPSKLAEFCCPGCECENTVMKLDDEDELVDRQTMFEADFEKRCSNAKDSGGPTPRRTNFPGMTYACACVGMRTMRGDAANSNCKECRARGSVEIIQKDGRSVPNCETCLCPCVVGQFAEGDVQRIAVAAAETKEAAARKENPSAVARATQHFGRILTESVQDGFKMLSKGSGSSGGQSSDLSEVQILSATAASFSRKEMRSEEELHELQNIFPEPTKKLLSGGNIKNVLSGGTGKRFHQNQLQLAGEGPISVYDSNDSDDPDHYFEEFSRPPDQDHPTDDVNRNDLTRAIESSLVDMAGMKSPPLTPSHPVRHVRVSMDHKSELDRKPSALSKKRNGEEKENEFSKRVVNQLTNKIMTGTPVTRAAAVAIIGQVIKPGTAANAIVISTTVNGTPAVGKSPTVVDALLMVQGMQLQSNKE